MESKEDSVAVAGSVSTDPDVLQILLASERNRVLAYIRKHFPQELSPTIEPGDVLQDVYIEVARRISGFVPRDSSSCFRWLATIARRRMARLLRIHGRKKRGGKSKRIQQSESIVAMLSELAMHEKTPSRSAARHEFMAALERALRGLSEDTRTAVTLHYVERMTCAEIARQMGRSEGAVQQLCYRGVQQVRRELRSASLFT